MYVGSAMIRFGADVGGLLLGARIIASALSALGAGNWAKAIGLGLAAVAIGLVALGIGAVQTAASFQQAMLKNAALAGLTGAAYTQFADQILALAPVVGQSPLSLAQGLYYVLSAAIPASQALATLKYSAELAAIGMTDTQTVADAMTTVMKVFGVSAVYAANSITVAVTSGKMQMADYAQAIGVVALSGKAAGFGLNTVNAALDVLTSHGFPSAAQAGRNLGQLFIEMDQNVGNVAAKAQKLGLSFDEAKFKTMSFAQQIAYLNQVTHGNQASIKTLLNGSIFALRAFDSLTGGAKDYAAVLAKLNAAQQGAGAEAAAWATTQQGATFQWNRLTAAVQVLGIVFGNIFLPVVTAVLNVVATLTAGFAEYIASGQAATDITSFFSAALALIAPIGKAFAAAFPQVIALVQNFGGMLRIAGGAVVQFASSGMLGQMAMLLLHGAVAGIVAAINGVHATIVAVTPFVLALVNIFMQVGATLGSFASQMHLASAAAAAVGAILGGLRIIVGGLALLFFTIAAPVAHLAQAFYQFVVSGGAASAIVTGLRVAFATAQMAIAGVRDVFATLAGIVTQMAQALHLGALAATVGRGAFAAFHLVLSALGAALGAVVGFIGPLVGSLHAFIASGAATTAVTTGLRGGAAFVGSAFSHLGTIVQAIAPVFNLVKNIVVALVSGFITGAMGVVVLANHFGILQRIGAMLWQTLQQLGQFLLSQLRPAWSSLSSALSSVGASMQQAWASIQQLARALEPLVPVIKIVAIALGAIVAVVVGAGLLTALGLLVGIVMGVAKALTFLIQGLSQMLAGIAQVFAGIIQAASGFFTLMVGLFTFNGTTITQGWNTLWSGVGNILAGTWRTIVGLFQTVFGTIWGLVSGFIGGILGFFNSLYESLVGHSIIPAMVNGILQWFQNLIATGLSLISNLVNGILQWFLTLELRAIATINIMVMAAIVEVQHLHDLAIQLVMQLVSQFITNLINLKTQAGTQIQNAVSNMTAILTGFVATCFSIGSNIIHAIGNGISGALGWLGGVMGNVGSFIGKFLPHSPAQRGELMHLNEYGPALVRGIATGVMGSLWMMDSAMRALGRSAAFSPQSMLGGGGAATMQTTGGLPGGMSQADISTIVAAVAVALNASGGGNAAGGDTVLEVDGRQLARVIGPHLAKENRLTLGVRSGMLS